MVLFNYMENLGRMLLQSPPATRSATPHMFILSGQVLTEDRLFLLRKSMNAVSQLWVNKANSFNVPYIRYARTGLYRQRNEHAQYVDQRIRDRNPNVHQHQQTLIDKKRTGMFGILEKMTIFAVVSCNNIIMAKENIIERINSSKKMLEKYDPLVLIEKLKSRDLKASNYFYAYTSALMERYLIRFFSPTYADQFTDDMVSQFYIFMFGERMRVDDLKTKQSFLTWISWEVSYFVLNHRKKKKDPVDMKDTVSTDNVKGSSKIVDKTKEWDGDEDEIEYTPELLQLLLNRINPLYAQLIRMSVCEGLKTSNIAEKLGYTPRFVSDKKNKGMDALKKKAMEYKKEYYNRKNRIF